MTMQRKVIANTCVWLLACSFIWVPSASAGACEPVCRAVSESGYFIVEVRPEAEMIALNQYHSWIVRITDSNGMPLSDVYLLVGGGMLGHGHGLPTQPRISGRLGEGLYRISGVLFNMHGNWMLRIGVRDGDIQDEARINLALDF